MINPDQIPDEIVTAAAKVIAEANGWREEHSVSICKPVALEAIEAALNAWPGAKAAYFLPQGKVYMLPAPWESKQQSDIEELEKTQ